MAHFAPPTISRTCARLAKPFISLREMNPVVFAGFPPRRDPKRSGREIDGRPRTSSEPPRGRVSKDSPAGANAGVLRIVPRRARDEGERCGGPRFPPLPRSGGREGVVEGAAPRNRLRLGGYGGSKLAPQALEKARFGLANGAGGSFPLRLGRSLTGASLNA